MSKLNQLISKCECSVSVMVNHHRDYYETIEDAVAELYSDDYDPQISDEVKQGILKSGELVELQFYPDTPVGFYKVVHHDVDAAIDQALAILKEEGRA